MSQEISSPENKSITVTTGVYDLIKDLVRRKKVSPLQEAALTQQLKHATQVTRKDLPADVVDIDTRVTLLFFDTEQVEKHEFVAPQRAKIKNNTKSILSPLGLALIGYKQGDVLSWDFDGKVRRLKIQKVEKL